MPCDIVARGYISYMCMYNVLYEYMLCKIHSVYTVQYILYSVQCIVYTVHCTLYNVYCIHILINLVKDNY